MSSTFPTKTPEGGFHTLDTSSLVPFPPSPVATGDSATRQATAIEGPPRLVCGRTGDHASIHRLLLAVFHGPKAAEFLALQDEPLYRPCDRLLVKRGQRILAHVHLTRRAVRFGGLLLPAARLQHLATLPEFRSQGFGTRLLAAAERRMVKDSAVLGIARTAGPRFLARAGWVVAGRHSYSTAGARDVLAYLESLRTPPASPWQRQEPQLNIRLWRRVEQDALVQLYRRSSAGRYGGPVRSDDYWRWLLSRKAYDRIYAAILGPDKFDMTESAAHIVGYAVMKENRILELVASPAHPTAPRQLLARACADAIERGDYVVQIDAPPDDPLHRLLQAAGGRHFCHEADFGEVFMVKLFDPIGLLRKLCPELSTRAQAAARDRPAELGLLFAGQKYQLVITRRSVKLVRGKLGRSYLVCGQRELAQMLLGHLDVAEAVAAGRMKASTRVALQTARTIFPRLPVWYPPWDDLPA